MKRSNKKVQASSKKQKTASSSRSFSSASASASSSHLSSSSHGYIEVLQEVLASRTAENGKYSMRSFAADVGVDVGVMSRVLGGLRPLSYKTALRMLDNLDLPADLRRSFLDSVEAHARQLDRGERSPERADRAVRSEEREVADLSPQELLLRERVIKARAKIDRCVVKNIQNGVVFVTTAVQGAEVDKNFLASVETFLKKRGAELIITTSKAHLKPLSEVEYPLDPVIYERFQDCVYKQVELNHSLHILDLDVRPMVTDPLAGLSELGAEEGLSYIFAHTQQRMKTYPNGMRKNAPRVQQCTGAITLPFYRNNKPGLLADKRHVVGGLVVEIRSGSVYHVRCVQADVDGSFVDLGERYGPDGTVASERPEALVRGDDHVGFGDAGANAALDDVTKTLRPWNIIVHDLHDAASVSHHRAHSIKARLEIPENVKLLADELAECRRFLEDMNAKKPKDSKILVIASNHNEHLHRYLNEGRFVHDIHNYKKAVELAYHYHCHGRDPLVQGVDPEEKLATWVTRSDEAVRIEGICVSNHGDKGPNGSRGSVRGDAVSYGRSSAGHSHSPEIWRGATRVGTSSVLDMDYTSGSPSSWAHAFELIYKGRGGVGLRQLVIIVDGAWRLGDEQGEKKAAAKKAATKAFAKAAKKASAKVPKKTAGKKTGKKSAK